MLPGRYAQWLEITMRYVSSVPVRSTFDPLFNVMLTISMSGVFDSTVVVVLKCEAGYLVAIFGICEAVYKELDEFLA